MSQYPDRNLPQLMELMHELVMPEPVSWLPETPGWWVLLGWLLVVVLLALRQLLLRRRRNRYRREAETVLRTIETQAATDPAAAAAQISTLLKRTALVAYPRQDVAPLYGADWARFLCDSANNDPTVSAAAEQLAVAAYRADVDGRELIKPAQRWIRRHRA